MWSTLAFMCDIHGENREPEKLKVAFCTVVVRPF
jgi:hypothetical protein